MKEDRLDRPALAVLLLLAATGLSMQLVSCAGSPVLDVAMGIGRSLFSAAANNYAPDYAEDLSQLINALVEGPKASAAIVADAGQTRGEGSSDETNAGGDSVPETRERVPIELDVLLMKEVLVGDRWIPVPIEDGDTLRDGGGVQGEGDNLKIMFRANTECYVYAIGIDTTGWVTTLYPDPEFPEQTGQTVAAHKEYVYPEGEYYFYFDQYRGKETYYFVASHDRRTDIEEVLAKLASHERPAFGTGKTPQPVEEPAIVENLRGIAGKRLGRSTMVETRSGTEEVTPTRFYASLANADLVVTRWFKHLAPGE